MASSGTSAAQLAAGSAVPLKFRGVFPILPTPFLPDEAVDVAGCETMVAKMADLGVAGVTVLGVLGEANRLTDRERALVVDAAVSAADGRMPVVVGASHAGTRAAIELAETAAAAGADAVMVTPHAEATPSEAKIRAHIEAIGAAVDLPVVLQDHPGSTGVHMSADLVVALAESVAAIGCVKQEALPSPPRVAELKARLPSDVSVLTGLGALYGGFELAAGADGFMTGFAFPEVLRAMAERDLDAAWRVYHRYLPLMVFENQPGVAVRKEIFRRRGMFRHAVVRAPGAGLSAAARRQLDDLLARCFGDADLREPLDVA